MNRKFPMEVVIATSNNHKLKEIIKILGSTDLKIFSLEDFPDIPPIEETGSSFRENALLKARTVFKHTGIITLADDSGLEVDRLDGAPGIYSARYAGEERNYQANNRKLLSEMKGLPDRERTAQFRCSVAIVSGDTEKFVEGVVRGRIIHELRGEHGFGYDPLFVPEGYRQTFAEMGDDLKNEISHRAVAFRKAGAVLDKMKSTDT